MRERPVIHFLVGPTAVGKTELSLKWAELHQAEIISCDAFCVYRGMDIGTAKPTSEERARVPHHGIDLVKPSETFSVHQYLSFADEVLESLRRRGCNILVTGGSGFYLKSYFAPVVDNLKVPTTVQAEVAAVEEAGGLGGLVQRLRQLNPGGTGDLDLQNPRRVRAALERCLASGKSVETLRREFEAQPAPFSGYEKRVVLLERDRAELRERVLERARAMVDGGLIEEVRDLVGEGIKKNPTAASAIGYRETLAHLRGEPGLETREQLVEAIALNTNKLVRKQGTWFRSQLPVDKRVAAADAKPESLFNLG